MSAREGIGEYRELALQLFKEKLGQFVADVVVREDFDQRDEPALFFEVQLESGAPLPLGAGFMFAHVDLRRALEDRGETRFPYLATRRIDGGPGDVILRTPEGIMAKKRAS